MENEIIKEVTVELTQDLFLGNTLVTWTRALIIFLSVLIPILGIKLVFRKIHKNHLKAGHSEVAAKVFLYSAIAKTNVFIVFVIALYSAALSLNFPLKKEILGKHILIVAIFVQILIWADSSINLYAKRYVQNNPNAATSMNVFSLMWKIIAFAFILVAMLDQLGFNVSTLVAGLGVGGVAIAFALQNVLGDIFGSLAIILDKPFKIGDNIQIGSFIGRVENVGLKTTRVRSALGELLIFSNNELLKSTIQNFGELKERRISLMVGVTYETPHEKLKKIPDIIREAIFTQKVTSVGHVVLKQLAESSLNFEVWYFIQEVEQAKWVDIEHNINLEIVRLFEKEGISFAYPTRTVYTKSF